MSQSGFIGIDLTSSPAKPSACVGLSADLDLAFAGQLVEDADLLALVSVEEPLVVAIDAPLSLPHGLCSLEESADCQPESGNGRECERQLARLGIPCYFTTKRSIIKSMVYRGIGLKTELEGRGFRVIEVYPYASKVCLWGRPIPRKSSREGIAFLRAKLVELMPGLDPYAADFDHDLCDAAVAAYTACLHHRNGTEAVGSSGEGGIWLPSQGVPSRSNLR